MYWQPILPSFTTAETTDRVHEDNIVKIMFFEIEPHFALDLVRLPIWLKRSKDYGNDYPHSGF